MPVSLGQGANLPPLVQGYETHVGSKTTMRFLNEALSRRYRDSIGFSVMDAYKECFKQAMGLYGAQGRVRTSLSPRVTVLLPLGTEGS